jgi:diguanylate cyclase (GGDEF)-like protein
MSLNLPRNLRLDALYRRLLPCNTLDQLAQETWAVFEQLQGEKLAWLRVYAPYTDRKSIFRAVELTGYHSSGSLKVMTGAPWLLNLLSKASIPTLLDDPSQRDPATTRQADEPDYPPCDQLLTLPFGPFDSSEVTTGGLLVGFSEGIDLGADENSYIQNFLQRLQIVLIRQIGRIVSMESQMEKNRLLLLITGLLSDFGTCHESQRITTKILQFFQREFGFESTLLMQVDDNAMMLYGQAGSGFMEEVVRNVRSSIDSSDDLFAMAFRNGQPQIFPRNTEPGYPLYLQEVDTTNELITIPMHVESQVTSMLVCSFDPRETPLHTERLHLYGFAADLLAQPLYMSNMYEKLRRTAETDPLTGCYNRLALHKLMEEEVPRVKRQGRPLSLLMVDLCDFKKFNDLYGHVVGDRILKTVARILMDCTRKSDSVIRYGGDEFIVLMPNTNPEQARAVVERIETAVQDSNDSARSEQEIFMLSIGLRSATGENIDSILEEADEDMYQQKADQSRTKLFNAFTSNNPDDLKKSDSFVAVLIKNLTQREPHFLEHARQVMLYSQAICQRIGNSDEEMMDRVSLASLLHDVGKIALPIGLLTKKGELSPEDKRQLRMHPTAGSEFLAGHRYLSDLRIIINHHHERWDGKTSGKFPGYPSGLAGEQIPLESRILHLAETYDDLTSKRPYREKPLTPQDAIKVLKKERGKAFDPNLTDVFVGYLEMVHAPLSDFSVGSITSPSIIH